MAGGTFIFCVYRVGGVGRGFGILVQILGLTRSLEPLVPVGGAGETRVFVVPQGQGLLGHPERGGWGRVLSRMFKHLSAISGPP